MSNSMKFKGVYIYLTGLLLSVQIAANAQGYVENALQFSSTQPGGSARILGIGSAQISLGGDYSSALSNPAGLGMFNRSEFTVSPAINTYQYDTKYFGNKESDSKSVFNIPGLSYVHHMPADKNGYLGGSFGFSLTRTNDFHTSMKYSGTNPGSSLIDWFVEQANGLPESQFEGANRNTLTGLAYNNYLIGPLTVLDPNNPDDIYFTDSKSIPTQSEERDIRGASNQWSISYGGNYKDILFFGGGIGITTMRFKSITNYREDFLTSRQDKLDSLDSFNFTENVDIDGSGFNATLGVIVRPVSFLQIGASLVTPTYYKLSSNYYAEMYSSWRDFDYFGDGETILGNESWTTDEGGVVNDYSITTPLKFSTGITLISQYGFISADMEMVNPGRSKYGSNVSGISFSGENDGIKDSYDAVKNFRLGGEFRYEMLRLRAGYGTFGNPYKNENIRFKSNYWSAGAGIKTKTFSADFAFVSRQSKSYYFPYVFSDGYADPVSVNSKINSFVLTLGFNL